MSEETEIPGTRADNQQLASDLSNRAAMLAVISGIAFALIGGISFFAFIESAYGKCFNLRLDAVSALFTFGPFCIVAAVLVAAIVTKRWTKALRRVVFPLLLGSLVLVSVFLQVFQHMLWFEPER
jgi:hypothetical protein